MAGSSLDHLNHPATTGILRNRPLPDASMFFSSSYRARLRKPMWIVLLFACAAAPALAQRSNPSDDPRDHLVVPADGVSYFEMSERASALLKQEKWAEAEPLLAQLTQAYPLDGNHWAQLGSALRHQNKHVEAIAAYERAIDLLGPGLPYAGPSNYIYAIAASHAALGHTDAALQALQRMVEIDGYVQRPDLMIDSNFASLRGNPRFRAVAGKVDTSRMDRVQGWRRDIDYLAAEFRRTNPQGAPIDPEFFAQQKALKAAVPKLDDQQIVAGMGRMMATLQRGHTALWLGDPSAPSKLDYRQMPIRLYIFPEGIFITKGRQGHEDLAGAQVLKFGRIDAAEMLRRVTGMQSRASVMESLWVSPDLLIEPGVLKGLGGAERTDQAELTLKMPDGSTAVKTLGVAPPERAKLDPPPGVKAPLFLRDTRRAHWLEPVPAHDAIYAQVNSITDDPDETIDQFGLHLRNAIADKKPHNLIVDLRHNNGGNTFHYIELLRTLIAFSTVEDHKVYVLIGRDVYSAAGNLSTDIERLVKPVFVGEPTGCTGNQWGDESMFVLPYSGLTGAFAGARWQLSHPWDERRSIVPQVPVQLTAASYFRGEDPALDAIFRLIDDAAKPGVATTMR
jgi:tetratricopeptide (TPR) repeat protein